MQGREYNWGKRTWGENIIGEDVPRGGNITGETNLGRD